jgi:5-methylcytosine-specific restriction endonuclease McrA
MKHLNPKRMRIKLSADAYKELHFQVLRRDGWRCQVCGSRENLEVHHKELRSHLGSDTEENLITVCNSCHSAIHGS